MTHGQQISVERKEVSVRQYYMEIMTIYKMVLLYRVRPVKYFENSKGAKSLFGQTQKVVSRL